MKRGIATFTLDHGRCPPWLFARMVKLGRAMVEVIIKEYGTDQFIRRIADPVWFQSLGTVLAFDWNASGLTTTLTAALKEAVRGQEQDLGVFICGGKGKTSRKTPEEILRWGGGDALVYNSKMAAKVDSSLVQDGYQIYHHSFMFSRGGAWAVIQQGMNTTNATARRYHWSSDSANDLINEPHTGIAAQMIKPRVLNLTAKQSDATRELSVDLVSGSIQSLEKDITILRKYASKLNQMIGLKIGNEQLTLLNLEGVEYKSHPVMFENLFESKYLKKILTKLAIDKPRDYEQLLATEGVGPKTIRALSLVAEVLLYGAKPSYEDPARYGFAHGGKDASPYPVDRETYDKTIMIIRELVNKTKLNPVEKNKTLKKLPN